MSPEDSRIAFHGLSDRELALAARLEEIAETKQKEILERMGVSGITRYTHIITAKNYAQKQKGIIIKHIFNADHPGEGGWYFYEHDKLKVSIGHPYADEKGRIKMHMKDYL
jgi:hypothetical protein